MDTPQPKSFYCIKYSGSKHKCDVEQIFKGPEIP